MAPDAAPAVSGSAGVHAPDSPEGSLDLDAIASALASGAIDPRTARARLIERAVRAQVPKDASPETIAAIRAEVEALLGDDPMIEQLLRP